MSALFSVYIATSLDGFIARSDGDLDWLLSAATSDDDHGYAAYMAGIDTLVMGRNTFEKVLTFGEWPYPDTRVVVLSRTLSVEDIPVALRSGVSLHAGPVEALVQSLVEAGAKGVYVDGGQVIQAFLAAGLLNELTITRIPILIGQGISLFADAGRDIVLEHLRTRAFDSGFVQSTYRITF